jgi:hypothetical protein
LIIPALKIMDLSVGVNLESGLYWIQQFPVRHQSVEIVYPQITQINADLKNYQ